MSALAKLGRQLGIRACNRFTIPGATVSWTANGQESGPDKFWPLSDISAKGLSFLTNDPLPVKSELLFVIALPNHTDTLEVRGEVAYSTPRGPRLTYGYRVGVEFESFAQPENGNSASAPEAIKALERIYGKRKRN